jgi:methionyl-tRNA formyltransferase
MDTGPMLIKREQAIGDADTGGTLHDSLSRLGAETLAEGLRRLLAGAPPEPVAQDNSLATMAPKLEKDHGRADFTRSAQAVCAQLRGVDPWPGAFTTMPQPSGESLPLKLWRPRLSAGKGAPGEVLGIDKLGVHVACGEGAVAIGELQLPGRKRLTAQALHAGQPLSRGLILGDGKPNPLLG